LGEQDSALQGEAGLLAFPTQSFEGHLVMKSKKTKNLKPLKSLKVPQNQSKFFNIT
jgi:hypothetical protein